MNIREVIERLHEVADELPAGLDSEVRVHICNGHDTPGVITRTVQVDPMWEQHEKTLEVSDSWAIVQGHPHLDDDPERTKPVTMDVDDVVQRWAAELAGDVAPSPRKAGSAKDFDVVVDPDTGQTFVLLHRPGQKSIKMEMDEKGIRYPPGSDQAIAAGCICDPERNNRGRGAAAHDDHMVFITKDECQVHQLVDPPD